MSANSLAALAQLGYLTTINFFVSWKATLTFHRVIIRRHTMFAICQTLLQPVGSSGAGRTVHFVLNRNADLMWRVYLRVDLPALVQTSNSATYAHWCNAVGFALMQKTTLTMGGTPVQTFPDIWLDIWSELAQGPGKQVYAMVGKYNTQQMLIDMAQQAQTLWIPVPLYNFETPGNAVPLAATPLCEIRLIIDTRGLTSLINHNGTTGTVPNKASDNSGSDSGAAVSADSDIVIRALVYYIYVEKPERDRFVNNMHEYLIEQVQWNGPSPIASSVSTTTTSRIRQQFNHLVKAIIVVARASANVVAGTNDYFNYGNTDGSALITAMGISVNNNQRMDMTPASYYTDVQAFDHAARKTAKNILMYSYAYFPFTHAPSGENNYGRVEDSEMQFNTVTGTNMDVDILGFSYNVVRFVTGLIILAFL